MKLTPLVMLAAMRIPALTDVFSDTLPVTSMAVVAGGTTAITCSSAHGVGVGSTACIVVVDALTPNKITAWSLLANDDVEITTQYAHDLTTTPDPDNYDPWDRFATLGSTGNASLDGALQLISVADATTFVVRPATTVTLAGTIPAAAALLKRLEREVVGWHRATATSATALTFPTPATVTRDYTVVAPKICTNVRVWGAIDLDHALRHFTRGSEADAAVLDESFLFVTPTRQARLSRDRAASSDAFTEVQPGAVVRQQLMDGFEIYAVMPAERYGGAVSCIDRAQGPVFSAVLKTFNGLKLPYSELSAPNPTVVMLTHHGAAHYDRANYVHGYTFEVTAYITDDDTLPPYAAPDIAAIDLAIQNGTPIPTHINPVGTVSFSSAAFVGIFQADRPQPLSGEFLIP